MIDIGHKVTVGIERELALWTEKVEMCVAGTWRQLQSRAGADFEQEGARVCVSWA